MDDKKNFALNIIHVNENTEKKTHKNERIFSLPKDNFKINL